MTRDNPITLTQTAETQSGRSPRRSPRASARLPDHDYAARHGDQDGLATLVNTAQRTGWYSPCDAPGTASAADRVLAIIQPAVIQYCRAHVGRGERAFASADDIAQEVCLAVFTSLPSYRDEGRPFFAFVFGIARHKIVDALRVSARNRAEPVADVPDALDSDADPVHHVLRAERNERLAQVLNTLPDKHRELLGLRAFGLSSTEAACIIKSTPGSVRGTQHRALVRLRELMTLASQPDSRYNPEAAPPAVDAAEQCACSPPVSSHKAVSPRLTTVRVST